MDFLTAISIGNSAILFHVSLTTHFQILFLEISSGFAIWIFKVNASYDHFLLKFLFFIIFIQPRKTKQLVLRLDSNPNFRSNTNPIDSIVSKDGCFFDRISDLSGLITYISIVISAYKVMYDQQVVNNNLFITRFVLIN